MRTLYIVRGDGYDLYIFGDLLVHVFDSGSIITSYTSGGLDDTMLDTCNRRFWLTVAS